MLRLKNIVKDYVTGETTVRALKGVSLDFRKSEFVSVLGASGCGKTTLLNIVGGLDRYTEGDLEINGVSTKEYTDRDWDSYRNHTVGFVFQTYNLIMHQTVLGNVELALTLSGEAPKVRREKALRALERVGLSDQVNKKPNQLSGGQMQRVAIARAIVNDPDIILADEPTGALDTGTSVQVMEILKEISRDRLIIMVTHNPDLAEAYSTRIVKLSDGELISDSNPVSEEEIKELSVQPIAPAAVAEEEVETGQKPRKTHKKQAKRNSMSFKTALTLSFKNLLTKKTRTLLVSFAGSIGIIGIALILSLSSGFQLYINKVQEDTLSSYPLTIESETVDMSSMLQAVIGAVTEEEKPKDPETIYSNSMLYQMMKTMLEQRVDNNLKAFNEALVADAELKEAITAIKYTYNLDLQIYFDGQHPLNAVGKTVQVNPSDLLSNIFGGMMMMSMNSWSEMLDNPELLQSQYDLVGEGSRWPTSYDEVVVVVDSNEEINDYVLYSLGLLDTEEINEMVEALKKGETPVEKEHKFSYDDILGLKYKLLYNTSQFNYDDSTGLASERSEAEIIGIVDAIGSTQTGGGYVEENGFEIEVVGIIKAKPSAAATSISGTIGYTKELTDKVIDHIASTNIVKYQLKNPTKDIFTGKEFTSIELGEYTIEDVRRLMQSMGMEAYLDQMLNEAVAGGMTMEQAEEYVVEQFRAYLEDSNENSSYEKNLRKLGYEDKALPRSINIYAADFESKDKIVSWIDEYNRKAHEENPSDVISYTDYVGIMMSSISTIISAISYVLIGFVAISLVVSSIMIGVITYISVLERTKEIGILRSIGASKKDISRVFNAETFVVGLAAGVFGVAIAMLIDIPINLILYLLAGLSGIAAVPWWGAIALILISVGLTMIAGIIPSRLAAKKDPVVALRTE